MYTSIVGCGDAETRLVVFYNSSETDADKVAWTVPLRLEWYYYFGSDFSVSQIPLMRRTMEMVFGFIAPILIATAMLSIVPLLVSQPIADIRGEVRQYMVGCTMSLFSYWSASFIVDLAIWLVAVTLIWAVLLAFRVQAFVDNAVAVFYAFAMAGPSTILMIYCIIFLFNDPDGAARNAFLGLDILLLIPVIVQIARMTDPPIWLQWVYSLFPSLHANRLLVIILINVGPWKQSLGWYWRSAHARPYLIMEFVDVVIWGAILLLIESVRGWFARRGARKTFSGFAEVFKAEREKHRVTEEAIEMERLVLDAPGQFAIACEGVSRLFFNTSNEPIPAVNQVTLGAEAGSIFGILGANGGGKTTLIKMITSMLPPSDGKISIFGRDIAEFNDPTQISICPQFNTHLCSEMTAAQHFHLYAMLLRLTEDDERESTARLIQTMGIGEIADKPIIELSGGDVRKVAIALAFLGPAKIVLLDEPTASLDAVGRRAVHELILSYKGEKTFVLCTHLLSEAEELCDNISILIRGCVYTVGTPEYLSAKFGTEYKVDVGLVDDSEETGEMCSRFFAEAIPDAVLSITRPKARIYNVPAQTRKLSQLFALLEAGKRDWESSGIDYYTCSSSSLERVFMEIVRMSECNDVVE
jgi:ABC-type multidrug transport system ATPase subunit